VPPFGDHEAGCPRSSFATKGGSSWVLRSNASSRARSNHARRLLPDSPREADLAGREAGWYYTCNASAVDEPRGELEAQALWLTSRRDASSLRLLLLVSEALIHEAWFKEYDAPTTSVLRSVW